MSEIRKKLGELSNGAVSSWHEDAQWRRENRNWLKRSHAIAFEVLEALDEKKLTQKKLAELMKVTPQYVNNIVKGSENLTLETIAKLEKALGIELMTVVRFELKAAKDTPKVSVVDKSTKNKITNKKAA
jgi:plasmid maintenance system antidote protein VapI